jgi:hypothetical protein
MFGETLLLALRAIRRNAVRSSLTILGIVIGVAAVITMVTLGGGATLQVASQIRSLGSNLLNVRPGQQPRGMGGARQAAKPFELKGGHRQPLFPCARRAARARATLHRQRAARRADGLHPRCDGARQALRP